jgi:hypothetical protein
LTDQVTAVLAIPVTVAERDSVLPAITLAVPGEIDTELVVVPAAVPELAALVGEPAQPVRKAGRAKAARAKADGRRMERPTRHTWMDGSVKDV